MDWTDYIGMLLLAYAAGFVTRWVIDRAMRRADEGNKTSDWMVLRIAEIVTLLRQQKERENAHMENETPKTEEAIDTTPAIEPTAGTDKQVNEQIAAAPNPAGDAPVAPTEG